MKFVFHLGLDDIVCIIFVVALLALLLIVVVGSKIIDIRNNWRKKRAEKKGERLRRR